MPTYCFKCFKCENKKEVTTPKLIRPVIICKDCLSVMSWDIEAENATFQLNREQGCNSFDGYARSHKERKEYFKQQGKLPRTKQERQARKYKKNYKSEKVISYKKD